MSRSMERSAQFGALQAGAPAGRQTRHLTRACYLITATPHFLTICMAYRVEAAMSTALFVAQGLSR